MTTLLRRQLLFAVLVFAPLAFADGPVAVQADVVFASTTAGKVDPSLVKMQQTLGAKVKYLTLEKRSSQKLSLDAKGATVALPNGKSASLTLEGGCVKRAAADRLTSDGTVELDWNGWA